MANSTGVFREKPQGGGVFFFARLTSDPKNYEVSFLVNNIWIREQVFLSHSAFSVRVVGLRRYRIEKVHFMQYNKPPFMAENTALGR